MNAEPATDWRLFQGDGTQRRVTLPQAPPWRRFGGSRRGAAGPLPYLIAPEHADVVNAALHLRRPLLVTGRPAPASPRSPGRSPMSSTSVRCCAGR